MAHPPDWIILVSSALFAIAGFLTALSIKPVWDAVTSRQVADLTSRMHDLGLDASRLRMHLRWWGVAMVASFIVVAFVLRMPPIAFVALYFVYISPRLLLQAQLARRQRLLRDQMVGACIALANSTRAGLSLAQGLEAICGEIPEPLASELRRIDYEFQRGRPMSEAILDTRTRLKLDAFTLFASAIVVCLERGGRITEALERISSSLQETQRLERKLEADTASGRKVVVVLAAFPFLFLLLFSLLDPEGTGLIFTHLIGQAVLLVVIALVYISVRWSRKILNIDF